MTIYKLDEICEIINGKDLHSKIPLGEILTVNETNLIYVKTSCFENSKQKKPSFFVKEEYIEHDDVPKLILKKGDLVVSKAINIGEVSMVEYDNTAIYRALTHLVPNEEMVLKKYLIYFMNSRLDEYQLLGNGSTIKTISLETLRSLEIEVPTMNEQRKIIDIIEPAENLKAKIHSIILKLEKILVGSLSDAKTSTISEVSSLFNEREKNIEQYSNKAINTKSLLNKDDEGLNKYKTKGKNGKRLNLLINTLGPATRKFSILHKDVDVLGELAILNVDSKFETQILGNLLSETFWNEVCSKTKGTTMQRIKTEDLMNIKLFSSKIEIENLFELIAQLNNINIKINNYIEKAIELLI